MVNVNGYDPLESFFNSIELVKNVFGPIESSFRKAAKDFEHRWPGSKNKVELFGVKKQNDQCVVSNERKKGLSTKVPFKTFTRIFRLNDACNKGRKCDMSKKELDVQVCNKEDGTCINCMHFVVTWSLLVSSFLQAVPDPLKNGKKKLQKMTNGNKLCKDMLVDEYDSKISRDRNEVVAEGAKLETLKTKDGNGLSLEHFLGFVLDQVAQNLHKFELSFQESESEMCDLSSVPNPTIQAVSSLLECKKADLSGFLGNLKFARVGGVPSGIVDITSPVKDDSDVAVSSNVTEENVSSFSQKMANGLLSIPLSNVERLRTTLSTVSLTELIELVPLLGRSTKDHPDKKKLFSVQDFFRYTEAEGRRFFEELDRDGDGQVTLEDLEVVIRKRKLPRRYAHELMRRTRRHLFSKSFGWKQFLSLMEQKEPTILRAYTSLCLTKSGTLQKSEILASLKNAGLPANEDNAVAMMRFLKSDTEESVSYGHFRNFMLLLPSDQLQEDPRNLWFQAATVVAVAPPVEVPTGSVLKSALAGGLASALSTSVLHPVDTIKTRVQASTLSFPEMIAKLPEVGFRGVYRGSIPAIIGQFSSHGLRTGIFEASKIVLINVAPTLPDLQVQSVASFCSTVLGTAVRIPCEVLKQRLQAGIFNNLGEAIICTWQQDGLKGFFRGTGATLCREVPFYVAGMGLYGESKKAHQNLSECDKKKLCKLIDFHKLSPEAGAHAAQNERLPLQSIVQVLYIEQLRLRNALCCNYPDDNQKPPPNYQSWRINSGGLSAAMSPKDNYASLRRENRELKLELTRLRMRLNDFEKEHVCMKRSMEKSSSRNFMSSFSKKISKLNLFGLSTSSRGSSSPSRHSQRTDSKVTVRTE